MMSFARRSAESLAPRPMTVNSRAQVNFVYQGSILNRAGGAVMLGSFRRGVYRQSVSGVRLNSLRASS